MILVIFAVSVLMIVLGLVLYYRTDVDFYMAGLSCTGVVVVCASIIAAIILGTKVTGCRVIDEKIAMYQEENARIEAQVDIIVENYMNHEYEVLDNSKVSSSIILAQLYPELKSDELVKSQIDIYIANNEKIKDLKLQKINASNYRWWLYFGK